MKRRNFFMLLAAALGAPFVARKSEAQPIKTYAATLCTTGNMGVIDGQTGSLGPSCPTGPQGQRGLTEYVGENDNKFYWTASSPYKAGDVVRYMDGSETRICFGGNKS